VKLSHLQIVSAQKLCVCERVVSVGIYYHCRKLELTEHSTDCGIDRVKCVSVREVGSLQLDCCVTQSTNSTL
jgi:hypothetical protein